MIGNDIVDLKLAATESDWKRKGFLGKLFTAAEQVAIADSPDKETAVWILWSMKEAAYKIYNRQTSARGFIPLRLEAKIIRADYPVYGEVSCDSTVYYTKTMLEDGIVHTVAVTDYENLLIVKEAAYEEVIKDNRGLPSVKGKPASVSHHGSSLKAVFLFHV